MQEKSASKTKTVTINVELPFNPTYPDQGKEGFGDCEGVPPKIHSAGLVTAKTGIPAGGFTAPISLKLPTHTHHMTTEQAESFTEALEVLALYSRLCRPIK